MILKNTLPKVILSILLGVVFTLSYGQTGTVNGTVLDAKKEPIMGATVKIKGSGLGAATDMDGKYSIADVPVGKQVLQISYIGYVSSEQTLEVTAGVNNAPLYTLQEDNKILSEVVVVGYGTQIKKEVSSSLSEVKSDALSDRPVYDFTSSLQGQAAGVDVVTDNGLAGATTTVRVRGTKSLTNSSEPLYVIDGVPIVSYDISNSDATSGYNISPMSSIDPADIESVVILKDASATAIYGARGAGGVILVTTKHGKSGKPKVDISFTTGASQAAHVISLLNGPQYMQAYYGAWRNDSASTIAAGGRPGNFPGYPNGITAANAANTNWLKLLLRTGHYEDVNVAVSGGDAKSTYYIGMNFRDDQSFMVGNAFKRGTFRANLDHTVNKYFSIGVNSSLSYTFNQYVPTSYVGGLGAAESIMLPIYPVYNKNGTYFLPNENPVAQINLDKSQNNTYRTISDAYMTVTPIEGLSFRNDFGVDMINQLENFYTSPVILGGDSGIATDRRDFYLTWNLNSTLDYKKEINQNNAIDVLVGFNPTETTEKYTYVSQTGFPTTTFTQPQGGTTVLAGLAGTGRQYSFMSYLARFNYTLYKRFLFQLSFRADGSSRFAPGNQYGYFPAGSVAYVMSDEKFFNKKQHAVSLFKIRASVGETGNANMTTDFAYLSTYSSTTYAGFQGITPGNLPVNNLTWETTLKSDLGFDLSFLQGRVSATLDLYRENTYNMIISSYPLSPSSGFSSDTRNVGSLYNEGVELQINTNNLGPKSKLIWKTTLNIATNKNEVTNLGGVAEVGGTNYGNNYAVVGQPVGVWELAKFAGINPQTGQTMIYDLNGNKVVATAGNTVADAVPVGRPYPYIFGGLTNTFTYKGFDLSVLLTFSVGNQIYDDDGKRQTGDMAFGWNQLTDALNAWTTPGQNTTVPKLSLVQNYDINTTRYLYNASFLRLRTLTLGYTVPARIADKMKMRSLRVFISGQNLAVATQYKGWDPETNRDNSGGITQGVSYLNTPQARVYTFGFNIGF